MTKSNWDVVLFAFCLILTPVMLIWTLLDLHTPIDALDYITFFITMIISGIGGLGIGLILAEIFINFAERLDDD